MGSLIIAEIDKGFLSFFKTENVYDLDWKLEDGGEIPPEFVGFIDKMFIRDSNYTPKFSVSAERITDLVEQAGIPAIDTVVAVDHEVLKDLLSQTGAVQLDGYPNGYVTAENYGVVIIYLIESQKEFTTDDKGILRGFVEDLKTQLLASKDVSGIGTLITANATQKHIQLFSRDEDIQRIFEQFSLDGGIKDVADTEDYLLVTNSSVGGNKTDPYIRERLIHNTTFSNGKVIDKLTVRKHHAFRNSEEIKWLQFLRPFGVTELHDPSRYILGRGDNVSQVKAYVPFGSELISSSIDGVQTFNDADTLKTYFLFPMTVSPGETVEVELEYKTPIKLDLKPVGAYSLTAQKQAGSDDVILEKHFEFEDGMQIHKFYPVNYEVDRDGNYSYETVLSSDNRVATVISE